MKVGVRIKLFLKTYRPFLRGSWVEYLIVFLAFTLLILLWSGSVALNLTTQLFAAEGDATAGFLWLNFVDPGLNPFLSPTDYVNYPYGETLGGPTFIAYAALWIPLRVLSYLFGPIAGLNIVMYWGYVSAAMASYWLLKRLTGSISVASFAGFATAFVPYAMYKSSGHLAYIFSYVFVLMIAGFIGVWSKPTKLRALLFALAIALAFYTDGYFVLLASVVVIGLCLAGITYSIVIKMKLSEWRKRIKALLLSLLFLVILLLPIAYVQVSQGDKVGEMLSGARSNIAQELKEYRANVVDFILPPATHPLFEDNEDFQTIHEYKNLRSNAGESTNYIGYVLIVLFVMGGVLVGVWLIYRQKSSLLNIADHDRRKFLFVACISIMLVLLCVSFMFSPEVYVFGLRIPLPGALLVHFDISLWRVMSRFFVPLHVVIVIFSAFTLWVILQVAHFEKVRKVLRNSVKTGIVVILGILLAAEYATTIHHPPFDFTKIAKGYQWLKEQEDIKVIVELPVVDPLDDRTGRYITAQIVHGKKMVNMKEPSKVRVTDTLGFATNAETIDWAYHRGAQVAITHGTKCNSVGWGKLVFKDDTENIKKAMCIYKITLDHKPDDMFITFGEGFVHSPNQPDPSVAVLDKGRAIFYVTKDDFKPLETRESVKITGKITGGSGDKETAYWSIKQDEVVLAEGSLRDKKTPFSFEADSSRPLVMEVRPIDGHTVGLGEFAIEEVKATDL